MMNEIVISTLEQGLIFAIVAIGVYITYKILSTNFLKTKNQFSIICIIGEDNIPVSFKT